MTLGSISMAFASVAWLVWLPGAAIARFLRLHRTRDWPFQLAVEAGMGLALWPALFLWTSTLHWRWTLESARPFAFVTGALGLLTLVAQPRTQWLARLNYARRNRLWLAGVGLLLLLTAASRLIQVRDLVLPAWVDPVHHTMIVRLFVEQGRLPSAYDPYIPGGAFFYHWGFHALGAWLAWLTGSTSALEIARNMLLYGQALNVLCTIVLYAAGRHLFDSRLAGLFAAVLGTFVSWFPAYYTSWGRYPQLAGVLLLPTLFITLNRLRRRRDWRTWIAVVLIACGLSLTHIRVAFFAVVLAVILLLFLLLKREWKTVLLWLGAAAATLIILLPWLQELASHLRFSSMLTVSADKAAFWSLYNEIPWALIWIPNNALLLTLATAGISGIVGLGAPSAQITGISVSWLLLLGAAALVWHRTPPRVANHTWLPGIGLLIAWSAAVGLFMNLDKLGARMPGFVNNAAAVITLFLPLCLIGGALAAWALGILTPLRWVRLAAITLSLAVAIWGAQQMQPIVNPNTLLVQPADLKALQWVADNTPEDAGFAINVKKWQGQAYAGTDAGYWLGILTSRRTLLPPVLYATAWSPHQANQLNALLEEWSSFDSLDDPKARQLLHNEGVDYIFIGAKSGHLNADKLKRSPYVEPVYAAGGAFVFKFIE